MIKFIATDLDGTLLHADRTLPKEIFPLIEQLCAEGILFAPASGRQYANLKKLFAPVSDKILFICENGALVKYRGETVYLNPIENGCIRGALDEIRTLPHLYPMLCGTDFSYIENNEMPFFQYAMLSYTNCKKVENLDDVIGTEPICKIAIYDEIAAAENCIRVLPQRLPELRTILSGYDWCDVSSPTANKGEAIRFLRKKFSFCKEECVAFGDQMNDYEMLLECGNSYVTENAYPPLKNIIRRTVPANTEEGVIRKIEEFLYETRQNNNQTQK